MDAQTVARIIVAYQVAIKNGGVQVITHPSSTLNLPTGIALAADTIDVAVAATKSGPTVYRMILLRP